MKDKTRLPATDSVRELASFWDTHDLTDFDNQLEVVAEPVFERKREPRAAEQPTTPIPPAAGHGLPPDIAGGR